MAKSSDVGSSSGAPVVPPATGEAPTRGTSHPRRRKSDVVASLTAAVAPRVDTPVRWPAAPGAPPLPMPGSLTPRVLPPAAPPPVLVVTAEPSLTRLLDFALEQLQLTRRQVPSAKEALQTLLDLPQDGPPPVVLLDADLPGMDGHTLLERLSVERARRDLLVIVLSSHADESVQVRSLLAGAVDHLPKPFNVRVLMAKVQRWVALAMHLTGREAL